MKSLMDSRIVTAFSLYCFLVLGVFLLVAPWTALWGQATVGLLPSAIGGLASSGWIRGIVSGLGALDLLVASQVALTLWKRLSAPPVEPRDFAGGNP